MPPKEVIPGIGLDSFSCPHCGAFADQHWFRIFPRSYQRDNKPIVFKLEDFTKAKFDSLEGKEKKRFAELFQRFKKNEITYDQHEFGENCAWELLNAFISMCHSCDAFALWIKDKLIWPAYSIKIDPHPDIPADIKDDFVEAADIVERSPRGSAALSRLIVQKLMNHLGGQGRDINANIASLVKTGLEPEIQKALDIVRVTGNNAVHRGEIVLKESPGTAIALLQLINLVVERRISTKKRIEEMFENLPSGALEQIQKRDGGESEGS
jgi:hypothetical protein